MSKANIMDHPHSPIYNIVHYIVLYDYTYYNIIYSHDIVSMLKKNFTLKLLNG